MSESLFWVFFGLIVVAAIVIYLAKMAAYRELPTYGEYLLQFPQCKTDRGCRCRFCGSGSIRNWGLDGASDSKRLFSCNHCGERLYRIVE